MRMIEVMIGVMMSLSPLRGRMVMRMSLSSLKTMGMMGVMMNLGSLRQMPETPSIGFRWISRQELSFWLGQKKKLVPGSFSQKLFAQAFWRCLFVSGIFPLILQNPPPLAEAHIPEK